MIKAVIFDMDGVVADSIEHDFAVWKRIFSEFGMPISFRVYKSFSGMKASEIVKKFLQPNISDAEARVWQDKKEKYFVEGLRYADLKSIPGVKNFLGHLVKAGYKIGLATAGTFTKTLFMLKKLSFENYFSAITTADEVTKGKPNPETFLKTAEKLKCLPAKCVVIEDAPNGVAAAKAGGMKCVAITTTHKKEELKEADKIIASFEEITAEMLQKL